MTERSLWSRSFDCRRPLVLAGTGRSLDVVDDGRLLVAYDHGLVALGPWVVER